MSDTTDTEGTEADPQTAVLLLRPEKLRTLGKNEQWLEDFIKKDPSILGLDEKLVYFENQRTQPSGGRLDLLLGTQSERYELELQLGKTDETHIIRTIEYWDVERRRFPNYEHTAIIAAEEISSRFFNVIYLLGYHIPIIALKVSAYKVGDQIALNFTKVLDTRDLIATAEENEVAPPTDRSFWLQQFSTEQQLKLAETAIKEITGGEPNYTKFYIGSLIEGKGNARIKLSRSKNRVYLLCTLPETSDVTERVEELEIFENVNSEGYSFFINSTQQLQEYIPILRNMFDLAMGSDEVTWPDETNSTHETSTDDVAMEHD